MIKVYKEFCRPFRRKRTFNSSGLVYKLLWNSHYHSSSSIRSKLSAITCCDYETRTAYLGVTVTENEEQKGTFVRASGNTNCTFQGCPFAYDEISFLIKSTESRASRLY